MWFLRCRVSLTPNWRFPLNSGNFAPCGGQVRDFRRESKCVSWHILAKPHKRANVSFLQNFGPISFDSRTTFATPEADAMKSNKLLNDQKSRTSHVFQNISGLEAYKSNFFHDLTTAISFPLNWHVSFPGNRDGYPTVGHRGLRSVNRAIAHSRK